ncbi:hypothetical protein SERLA73DRAFT_181831 [Serpula lacrymans var. lacrymans S7.3]|uniref:Nudix hydrolase domain-containing protein n=2 Tax=Serpula lacrymans var. lacrymans TaxID=341189 RepID=F8PYT5_SERL3|nr:uncharacterized protein SERLADRAFT_468207 [Serpula lacrymans var. lacrymans S7.9]EGN99048.1 hypothetical protein SERLA73DRAFT_181831 [Serpula lacrymans var. lacrymans S7.3]EGO24623.1 hypothetical protein SERLADRAFT_468207 [Serpula lacrymans var. lacrymans S7.9]
MAIVPTFTAPPLPPSPLDQLSEKSKLCIHRLRSCDVETPDLSSLPVSKLAAVLVLLYEKSGELRVLLTTRSKLLRSHPGQTALPGGKVDVSDRSLIHAALREAHEEVALPLSSPHVHTLCLLRPFLSASQLLVTPVVALLTDISILDLLEPSPAEVDRIFDHPLEAILDPSLAKYEPLVPKQSEHWPYETEYYHPSDVPLPAFDNRVYRMHRFRSCASPVKGLTAEILIFIAEIAYGRAPTYELYSSGQSSTAVTELVHIRMRQYQADFTLQQSKAQQASVTPVVHAPV